MCVCVCEREREPGLSERTRAQPSHGGGPGPLSERGECFSVAQTDLCRQPRGRRAEGLKVV